MAAQDVRTLAGMSKSPKEDIIFPAGEDCLSGTRSKPAYFSDKDANENVAEVVKQKPMSTKQSLAAWWMKDKNHLPRDSIADLLRICREDYRQSSPNK